LAQVPPSHPQYATNSKYLRGAHEGLRTIAGPLLPNPVCALANFPAPHPAAGIGACHFAEGRLEEAIVHFAAVADIDPSEASLFNLANAQGKAEHSVAAAATYRRVLKLNPNRHDALAKLVHFTHYVCDWSRRKSDVPPPP
jgi:tetratricopeptide (TPR) repeat protein